MIMAMVPRKLGAYCKVIAAAAVLALLAYPSAAGASAVPTTPPGANGAIDAISCASACNLQAVGTWPLRAGKFFLP